MKIKFICICLLLSAGIFLNAQNRFSGEGFELKWEVRDNRLIADMTAPTTGWLGFGITGTGEMETANLILAWVDDMMGIAMGEDHYGTGGTSHENDMSLGGSQDLLVLAGRQTADETSVTFSIPLDSGDRYDTVLERGSIYTLLLTMSPSDDTASEYRSICTAEILIP